MKNLLKKLASIQTIAGFDVSKITHLPYWLFIAENSGLYDTAADPRNFKTEKLGWSLFGYTPKAKIKLIHPLSVKDQKSFNTCTFNAAIGAKEIDEKTVLSVRGLVAWAVKNGMVSGNGFASLDASQKGLKGYGAINNDLLPDTNIWNSYINVDLQRFAIEADKHKTQTYWTVTSKDDILKLLDEDRPVTNALDWMTGFNQGGGFSYPWIIDRNVGYSIGGHSTYKIGYIFGYKGIDSAGNLITGTGGKDVYVCQNSYGENWGASFTYNGEKYQGIYFLEMNYYHKVNSWSSRVNLDIGLDTAKFLNEYDGKNVKGSGPTIYLIQKGVKKAYPDEVTYCAFFPTDPMIIQFARVQDDILSKIPNGDNMDITKSLYWDLLKNIQGNEGRINRLTEILRNKN